jgi:hypothetical protein
MGYLASGSVVDYHIAVSVKFQTIVHNDEGEAYHAIIGSALSTEIFWLRTNAFVDYSIREHSLVCNTKDKCPERCVIPRLTLIPHAHRYVSDVLQLKDSTLTIHSEVDLSHSIYYLTQVHVKL